MILLGFSRIRNGRSDGVMPLSDVLACFFSLEVSGLCLHLSSTANMAEVAGSPSQTRADEFSIIFSNSAHMTAASCFCRTYCLCVKPVAV